MVNSSGTTTYTWDFENRLATTVLPGSGGTVYYKYDPFGRRIYKSSTSGTFARLNVPEINNMTSNMTPLEAAISPELNYNKNVANQRAFQVAT